MKPKLQKFGQYWRCTGWCGAHRGLGFGKTPWASYSAWLDNLERNAS